MIDLPGYAITEKAFDGSETVVYRGRREVDGAPVAIKMTRNEYPTAKELARLRREFALLQALSGVPGVVQAYSLETCGRGLAMVMEDLGGCSLSARLRAGRLDMATALHIGVGLAMTLESLHKLRIIHKDIKPHNVMVDERTLAPRLIDLGISTRLPREVSSATSPDSLEGTLAYIAPEQTGRMNRAVDLRADLYSLGVTLYEMLTGSPPFWAPDPMELIHCHMARTPTLPHERERRVPAALSDVVMKLLAKTPEDRYQSARGLIADLEECQRQWETTGRIEAFPTGLQDIVTTLRIPQKLYGREQEVAALLSAFERAQEGGAELLLLSGYSGIGKSALVSEIHKPIAERGGYFVRGKFDQIARDAPLSGVARAFRELVRQILTESPQALAVWKEKLSAAAGVNVRLLVELIPDLELILDSQPLPAALGPIEAKNRFGLLMYRFVRAFAAPKHPLVIFLDDLQWVDPASVKLLASILGDPESTHILIIGAYRDNEVDAAHPLRGALSDLREAGTAVTELKLTPLAAPTVTQMLAETLSASPRDIAPLAELVFEKTQGNPFFLSQFLRTLHENDLLRLDTSSGAWSWDTSRIGEANVTDNVADLLLDRLHRLPQATQRALRLAACVGYEFDLGTLSTIAEEPADKIASDLWAALDEGLIVPLDGNYLFVDESAGAEPDAREIPVSYQFLHDRVWESAYGLIEPEQRSLVHVGIGRLLRRRSGEPPRDEDLLEIVRHVNLGASAVTDEAERDDLARQNLRAGRMAKGRVAYQAAAGYFTAGRELAGDAGWERDAELCFALHLEGAESLYLSGEHERAEALFAILLPRSTSPVKQARVHDLRLHLYVTRARYADAVQAGIDGLAGLGETLPETEAAQQAAFGALLAEASANLGDRRIEDLIDAPVETDPERKVTLQLLGDMTLPAYFVNPGMYPVIVLRMVNLSLAHGTSDTSAFSAMAYGFMLSAVLGRHAEGHAFGKLALALTEKLGATALVAKVHLGFAVYLHFSEPLRNVFPHLERARRAAAESGDFAYLSTTLYRAVALKLGAGHQIEEIRENVEQGLALMHRIKDVTGAAVLTVARQVIACLQGRTESRISLSDAKCDEPELLAKLDDKEHGTVFFYYHLFRLEILYLHGDHTGAAAAVSLVEQYSACALGMYSSTLVSFYACLALLARGPLAAPEDEQRREESIARHRGIIATLSEAIPQNYHHKLLLIDAEAARAGRRYADAMDLYEQAIALAKKNHFPQEEALAGELCARMHLGMGRPRAARGYLLDAYLGYLHWGATAKAEDLAEEHKNHFSALLDGGKRATTSVSTSATSNTTVFGGTTIAGLRDAALVVRAAQDIAGEIDLPRIVERLVKIVLLNAGAQQGALLLLRDGKLFVEARFTADPEGLQLGPGVALDATTDLPQGPLLFVTRTREPVVLHDAAADPRFGTDPYVVSSGARSMLCLPLLHQGTLSGVLYLENKAMSAAFGLLRVQLLSLLSSQAAIAIQHAQLVTSVRAAHEEVRRVNERLEAEVAQRTEDLRASNDKLQFELLQRVRAERERAALQEQMFDAQRARLAEMSTPLIPITGETMVMPLIGTMDSDRAKQVLEVALEGAHRHQARVVIIDITGMRDIDTHVVGTLVATANALNLLGTEAVLTGIRSEVAQAMVKLDINLGAIVTMGTLQAGIAYALKRSPQRREARILRG